jgi:amino-acid N-acetyltransferase
MLVRKARLQDATNIYELVNSLSHDGTLLRRVFAEICENVRDFTVAESDSGVFLGCGALHLYGPHLAEVRSIVVRPEAKGQGGGAALLNALLDEAEDHGVGCVCLFTRIPDFFFRYGFRVVEDRVRAVLVSIVATKLPWLAVRFPRCRFSGPVSKRSSLCA